MRMAPKQPDLTPSTTNPAAWLTIPPYDAPTMNPQTNVLGPPWNNFMIFMSSRAAALGGVADNVTTLQGQVAVLSSQVASLGSEVNSLANQVSTLSSQVSALSSS